MNNIEEMRDSCRIIKECLDGEILSETFYNSLYGLLVNIINTLDEIKERGLCE